MRTGFHSGYDGRTDYQLCLTDTPDSDSDSDTDTDHGDRTESPRSASPQCDAGSDSYSAPLDGSWEEHRQWIADGCPDSDQLISQLVLNNPNH